MLNKSICIIVLVFIGLNQSYSQSQVKGKITDENGEFLIGVTITYLSDPSFGTTTDFDGYYEIDVPSNIETELVFSYVGYDKVIKKVNVPNGESFQLDVSLGSGSIQMQEIEIVGRAQKKSAYYMESIKKKSLSTLDYMSGDLMKKIGDSNVSSAISRVTGVSTNGSFITVRGIGDRYVKTTINGSIIPTLDPFTNNIKLDLFPSSLVDNIVITKNSNPALPSDWAAAYISIETKDYPDNLAININTKVGYNSQVSFKEVLSNETSSTDWLGFDNNFREVDHSLFKPVNASPSRYEELSALGLTDFYKNLGVTESWQAGSQEGELYFRLGLVELGLLGKAFIDNEAKVNDAKELYTLGTYQDEAYTIINREAEEFNSSLANNWSTFKRKAPLNFSQTFSVGNKIELLGIDLGYIVGLVYNHTIKSDPSSQFNRTLTSELDSLGNPAVNEGFNQEIVSDSYGWTGLANLNMKFNENNNAAFLFMPNFKGTNKLRKGIDLLGSTTFNQSFLENQFYEERSQIVYQLNSEHYFPKLSTKFNFNGSYTNGDSSAPDFKDLRYFSDDGVEFIFDKTVSNVRRNFRNLNEDVLDLRLSAEINFAKEPGNLSKLYLGGSFVGHERNFNQFDYLLQLNQGTTGNIPNGNLNNYFTDERFEFSNSSSGNEIDLFYKRFEDPSNQTIGRSKIYGAFIKFDKTLSKRIKASGGWRFDYTDIFTDIKLFSELGYEANDFRRQTPNITFVLKPGVIKKLNFLPSISFLYKLNEDDDFPYNLRVNYYRSIARPSLREYSETFVRDFELNADVFGNADLKLVDINNIDLRIEKYFQNGDNIFVSLFYKDFKNHIELLNSNLGFSWANADKSNVYGLEVEGKKDITDNLEFRANASIVNSFTRVEDRILTISNGIKTWEVIDTIERSMFGQAPYVINAILNYDFPTIGLTTSLSYNIQGPKLVLTSIDASPDIFEKPRSLLNLKISKTISKHFKASFSAKDILNSPIVRSYKFDEGFLLDFDRFQFGTNFSLGISYSL